MRDDKVAVVGAGTMGSGIAHVFALHGYDVGVIDVNDGVLARSRAAIEANLNRQVKKDVFTAADRQSVLERIAFSTDLGSAVGDAFLVVEAATEHFEAKASIFRQLDESAPSGAILSSNTSSISITSLAGVTKRAGRVIGMHFFNPVPVMKLVEIVRGLETTKETFDQVFHTAERLGKTAVEVNDFPGFVSNRVLMPMINEAVYCLMEGVASKDDIDTVMKLGMNHPMGPLTLADFIGLDVCLSILNVLHEELGDDKYRACPLLKKMVAAGRLGRKASRGFYDYS